MSLSPVVYTPECLVTQTDSSSTAQWGAEVCGLDLEVRNF